MISLSGCPLIEQIEQVSQIYISAPVNKTGLCNNGNDITWYYFCCTDIHHDGCDKFLMYSYAVREAGW